MIRIPTVQFSTINSEKPDHNSEFCTVYYDSLQEEPRVSKGPEPMSRYDKLKTLKLICQKLYHHTYFSTHFTPCMANFIELPASEWKPSSSDFVIIARICQDKIRFFFSIIFLALILVYHIRMGKSFFFFFFPEILCVRAHYIYTENITDTS